MKDYIVTYLPHMREDKEWISVSANNEEDLVLNFKAGIILNIE
jgi:hypothetical protein